MADAGRRKNLWINDTNTLTPLVVVMDRLNVHRSAIRLLQDERARWFDPELLPAYAPELNPVELVWGYFKYGRLANVAPDTVDEIQHHVRRERRRLARESRIGFVVERRG